MRWTGVHAGVHHGLSRNVSPGDVIGRHLFGFFRQNAVLPALFLLLYPSATKADGGEMWRDNLDENGAAIRMRAGSRDNMMIALSLGLCKPHLRCRPALALCQSRPGGASCRSSHVRNAPKATAGRQNVARRDGPYCDIRSFDVVDCLLVDGLSKRQLSPTAQRLCDALNCLGTIQIGRGQFGELLEIRQRALQIVLSFP